MTRSGRVEPTGDAAVARAARLRAVGVVTGVFVVVVVSMVAEGAVLHRGELATSWQLDDLSNLGNGPIASTWYRHVQPPLFNLTIGALDAWNPLPFVGSVYVVFLLGLWAIGLLLAELLLRWRTNPWVAGAVAGFTLVNPMLLSSIVSLSYEVPVLVLLCASLLQLQRFLEVPSGRRLVVLAVLLTSASMMRSLLHPVWILVVLGLAVAARRVGRRGVLAAFAVPLVVVGGWTLKNAVLFDTATTSSWFGFNLQRGVVAPMAATDVRADVAAGRVSGLARQEPWQPLATYEDWTQGCTPTHSYPSLVDPVREEGGANFNHECFLPVYERAQSDAALLVLRHPGRYVATRVETFPYAFGVSPLGQDDPPPNAFGPAPPGRTWMDVAADRWLLPVDAGVDMADWNLPFFGLSRLDYRLSLTMVVAAGLLWIRGAVAIVRLARAALTDRGETWDAAEVVWVVAALTVGWSIVVGNLTEFGENQRFRTAVDPILLALPLAAAIGAFERLIVRRGWRR